MKPRRALPITWSTDKIKCNLSQADPLISRPRRRLPVSQKPRSTEETIRTQPHPRGGNRVRVGGSDVSGPESNGRAKCPPLCFFTFDDPAACCLYQTQCEGEKIQRDPIDLFPLFRGDAELIIPIPELLRGRERQRGVEDETAITPFSLPPSLSLFLVIFLPSLAQFFPFFSGLGLLSVSEISLARLFLSVGLQFFQILYFLPNFRDFHLRVLFPLLR